LLNITNAKMTSGMLNQLAYRGLKRTAADYSDSEDDEPKNGEQQLTPPIKRRFTADDQHQTDEHEDDNESNSGKSLSKRRKKRRRRQKRHVKGYYEMSESERRKYEERTKIKAQRMKDRMLAKGHMLAPYNSSEFLINDANDDTLRKLDEALHDGTEHGDISPTISSGGKTGGRSRNSSFSLDSEDDFYYSSPDDEDEFLTKEFNKDIERSHCDRLENMKKDELILEFLGREKQMEALEKRLEEIQDRETTKELTGEVDYEFSRGEVPMEPETAQKIKIFQGEIRRLMRENKNLHLENARLKRKHRTRVEVSTSSDEDEEIATAGGSNSINSGINLQPMIQAAADKCREDGGKTEDTGYESTQSKEQTPERDIRRHHSHQEDGC